MLHVQSIFFLNTDCWHVLELPQISPCPTDLSNNTLSILEKLMLAQAQECAYSKAAKDKKTVGVLARLAKQASVLYGEVLNLMNAPTLKDYFDKTWQVCAAQEHWCCCGL